MESEKQLDNLTKDVADIKTALAVNTVKTSNVENIVVDINSQIKDIRSSFITHNEYEVRHKQLMDDLNIEKDERSREDDDHETRIRRLEYWGAIAIGISFALQFYFNFLRGR